MIVPLTNGEASAESVGEGPCLLLLHSLLTDRGAFSRVVPDLATDRKVIALDLPGFGASTLCGPDIDEYAAFVADFLSAIEAEPATTDVIGNGLGSFVALGLAINHGELLRRLIMLGAGAVFADPSPFARMAELAGNGGMAAVADIAVGRILSESFRAAHPEEERARREVLSQTNVTAFVNACRALQTVDYSEQARRVLHPSLVLTGTEDVATPPGLGRALADLIPNGRFVEMAGVGHAPQIEDPPALLAALRPFLAR